MKTTMKVLLLIAMGVAWAGGIAIAQPGPNDPAGPPPNGPRFRPPPLERVITNLLDKYDLNHDGILDQNELAALRQDLADGKVGPPRGAPPLPKDILDQYDLNKDGQLDAEERAALQRDVESGKVQLPPPPAGRQGRGPGFQPPSAQDIIGRYDVDKDGKLDANELAAFLKDLPRHRPPHRGGPGPEPMGGPGGAPPNGGPGAEQPPNNPQPQQ